MLYYMADGYGGERRVGERRLESWARERGQRDYAELKADLFSRQRIRDVVEATAFFVALLSCYLLGFTGWPFR